MVGFCTTASLEAVIVSSTISSYGLSGTASGSLELLSLLSPLLLTLALALSPPPVGLLSSLPPLLASLSVHEEPSAFGYENDEPG